MIVGLPKEIKDHEYRVALTPAGAAALVRDGHRVLVQGGAGEGSGFDDEEYAGAGAQMVAGAEAVFAGADLVVKVKEPLPAEYAILRPGLVLFTYLHLAAEPELTSVLLEGKVTAIAYETVQLPDRSLPLLTPMSEVAGRLAVQVGAHYLEKPHGGQGKLLAGVPGVAPARVVILGAGVVGSNAAEIALGMGAHVTIMARGLERLRHLSEVLHGDLETIVSTPESVADTVPQADLLVGAVLVPGAKAPRLVTRAMVRQMRAGAVIVDVSVDQGGCVETIRPTSHSHPVYAAEGVIHYGVPNMPGAVPHTSTLALCNATLPYILRIAGLGAVQALGQDPSLVKGLSTFSGVLTNVAVGGALGLPARAPDEVLRALGDL